MKNDLHNLKKEAEQIRLSASEKSAMHAQIFGLPALKIQKVRSPYTFFFSYQSAVSFAMVLVLVVGSTTAYAAQGTIPGDLLYSVKINVNEPARGAFAVSDEAKISFHTGVAEERLKEAETLAAEGRLNTEVTATIEASVEDHIARASSIAASIEAKNPAGAVEASAVLDSSIAAHGRILARIGSGSSDEATKENSRSLSEKSWGGRSRGGENIMLARSKEAAPQNAETMSLAVANDSAADSGVTVSADQKNLILQLEKKAQAKVDEAGDAFWDARDGLVATTTQEIKVQLEALDAWMEEGERQYKDEAYVDAEATFTAVLEDAVELSAYIGASKKFKRDFVRPNSGGDNDDRGWGDLWSDDDSEDGEDEERENDDDSSDNSSSNGEEKTFIEIDL